MIKRVAAFLFLTSASLAFAQSRIVAPRDASLQALTEALTQGHGGHDLVAVAAERQARLVALVKTDTARALREMRSSPTRSLFSPRVRDFIEEKVEFEGVAAVLIEDREDGSRQLFTLQTDSGDSYDLFFGSQPPNNLLTGQRVRIAGFRIDSLIAVESGQFDVRIVPGAKTSSVSGTSALPNTLGEQKIAVILVNFSDNRAQPFTVAYARDLVFNTINNYYLEASYGQTWLTGDVFGWYTIAMQSSAGCDISTIANQARSAATAAGVNLSNYNRHVFAFPRIACNWGGLGTIGGNPSQAWLNQVLPLLDHELGHNLGLVHSHSIDCGDVILGTSCRTDDAGDLFDTMGGYGGHFNAFQKERLGWLGYGVSPPIVTVTSSGTYSIDAYETVGSAPKVLKILRGTTGSYFYVETRKPIGVDAGMINAGLNVNVFDGVLIHRGSPTDSNSSHILDMTLHSSLDSRPTDPALTVGQTFTDSLSGVSVTTNSLSATGASVSVTLGTPPPPASCTHVAPSISLSPSSSLGVAPGSTISLTLLVSNKDVSPCTASTFTLTSAVPAGWTGTLAVSSLSIAPGASASTTLSVKSPTTAANGSYSISATARNASATTIAAAASATYNVSNPTCTHVAPLVTLTPSTASGVAGAAATFTVSVMNKDVSPCLASNFTLSSVVPSGWSGTLTAGSLSVSPGASASTTLTVTPPTSAAISSYTVTTTAKNSAVAAVSTTASASYAVVLASPPPSVCTHVAPLVSISPGTSTIVSAGSVVSFTVSVTSKDVSPCSSSTFNLTSVVPAGWTRTLTASSVSVLPGASVSTSLRVTSPASAANGSYTIAATATNSSATAASGSGSAAYLIGAQAGGGSFTDDFNRTDSSELGSYWTEPSGNLVVAGGVLKNALGQTGNSIGVLSAMNGLTETAEADFTSVDNNLGPRFGILLRYQDYRNYYLIYRQTGGSSRLLIAKVVNGVETVLAATSISNPAKNVAFHIKARVTGTTLSLDFEGTNKINANDATFPSGKVGILIGSNSSSSQQQADNFSASVQ